MASNDDLASSLRALYTAMHIELLAIGIQLFLCVYGLSVYLSTPVSRRKQRKPYIILSFVILTLFVVGTIPDSTSLARLLIVGSQDISEVALAKSRWEESLGSVANLVVAFIGDGLLIYRCYLIRQDHRWVIVVPCIAYVVAVGLSTVAVVTSNPNVPVDPGGFGAAWISLSVFVNIYITSTICWRLYQGRRELLAILPDSGDFDIYDTYAAASTVLIESALPFTIFGIIAAFFYANPAMQTTAAFPAVLVVWFSLSAICPQLIIFRVTTGTSRSHGNSAAPSLPLQFAAFTVPIESESDTQPTSSSASISVSTMK